jgi:hypothetical protein
MATRLSRKPAGEEEATLPQMPLLLTKDWGPGLTQDSFGSSYLKFKSR